MHKDWFASWFDSPFYHLLYQHRDEEEAQEFVDNLIRHLEPEKGSHMLDIACGKGRFSKQLAEKGFFVTGIDLSEGNITEAKVHENELLSFYRQDMRKPFRFNHFDYAFNFFTSFGYFDNEKDHLRTLESVYKSLKPNGIFVIDFMNAHKAVEELVPVEKRKVGDTVFNIERKQVNGYLVKEIEFSHNNKKMNFRERVRAFTLVDFREMLTRSGFDILEVFGDYDLNPYEKERSNRLIIISKKA
jgi:SAM-dependent methyltransferase